MLQVEKILEKVDFGNGENWKTALRGKSREWDYKTIASKIFFKVD